SACAACACDSAVPMATADSARIIPATSTSTRVNPRRRSAMRTVKSRIQILPVAGDFARCAFVQMDHSRVRRQNQGVDDAIVGELDPRAVAFARRLERDCGLVI